MCNIPYNSNNEKIQVLKTFEFLKWFYKQPPKTQVIIISRLDMLSIGHFGDYKKFEGLIELRWKNGIRIYLFSRNKTLIVALNGGNKNGQNYDIKKAKKIRQEIISGARSI
ncbi:MAG: type II toxin-antitoxin system RelE/ParE family toxin [Rhizobacter sp.]|nr:type II toxin-antitoxin system RelE/ParE family toxin [Bacteriovorax sp.]